MMSLWGVRLALCAVAVAVIAIAAFRLEIMAFRLPLLAVAAAVLMALVALVFSAIGIFNDSVSKLPSVSLAVRSVALLGAFAIAIPGLLALRSGVSSPPIHDVSTAPDEPPVYEFVMSDRQPSDNSLELDAAVIAQQREAYPALSTLSLNMPLEQAYGHLRAAMEQQGWKILGERMPAEKTLNTGEKLVEAQIEAVAETRIFGFKDDVAVRLRASGAQTHVDMRSVSRVGISDLGANARRISSFFDGLKTP